MLIRELSDIEKSIATAHDYFNGHGIVCFRLEIKGNINEVILQQALDITQGNNVLLQAYIRQKKCRAYFYKNQKFPCIPLTIIRKTSRKLWQKISYLVIKQKFDVAYGPLIKLFLLKSPNKAIHDILIVAHHSLIDGMSAILFLKQLLLNYQKIFEKVPLDKISQNVDTPLDVKKFLQLSKYKNIDDKDLLMQINNFMLTQKQTEQLIKKCSDNFTSIFGLLTAISVKIIHSEISYKKSFFCAVPINMRKRAALLDSENKFGCYIAIYRKLQCDPNVEKLLWDEARRYKDDLHHAINDQEGLNVYYPKNTIAKLLIIIFYKLIKPLSYFGFNNMGLLVVNNFGKHTLSCNSFDIRQFNSFANVTLLKKNRFFLNAITLNGRLCLTLRASFKGINNKALANKFLKTLKEAII